jgi:hypothetical protein
LRDIPYKLKIGPLENAYYDVDGHLVLLRGASLPNVCVVCGSPAHNNTISKEFEQHGFLWHLPSILWTAYLIFGKRYLLTFPFCPNCGPDDFSLFPVRINETFAKFAGTSKTFLKSLPPLPPDLGAETNEGWFRRSFRWLWT